jgi:hypothetical protein
MLIDKHYTLTVLVQEKYYCMVYSLGPFRTLSADTSMPQGMPGETQLFLKILTLSTASSMCFFSGILSGRSLDSQNQK